MGAPADALVQVQLKPFPGLAAPQQVLFWVAFFAGCGILGYTYMLLTGVPGWVPHPLEMLLQRLPGL